jgi:hypothetical protein
MCVYGTRRSRPARHDESISDASGSAEPLPLPDHEVVEGRTWDVRPTLPTTAEFSKDRLRGLNRRLRSGGIRCWVGWLHAAPGEAVTATILVDAETPGVAGDIGTRLLLEAAAAEGIATPVVHEVEVLPAWRDEDDMLSR